jgi:hypothetical protein
MDILITKNNFQTLMNVIIVDLTHTDMVQRTSIMTTHVMMLVVQDKNTTYVKRALGDDFIPLAIEMYGCFHFHFDYFFIACAHTIIPCHQRSSIIPHFPSPHQTTSGYAYYKRRILDFDGCCHY